jgi:hypothetical protein
MNRKLFIRNVALGIGTCIASPITQAFSNTFIQNTTLRLKSNNGAGKIVKISGKFLDANTLENIAATIQLHKGNSIYSKNSQALKCYSIENEMGNSISEKITYLIKADGYKPFEGELIVSKNSVNIDTKVWEYNPNFNPENRPNQHTYENGLLTVNFDFHLVKV